MFEIGGKVALVTGAGQGVGEGIARVLAAQGAAVAVNDLVEERADRVVAGLREGGRSAIAAPFDVTTFPSVTAAVRQIEKALGPVDILVNNAGVPAGMDVKPFRDSSPEDWPKYLALGAYGVMNCVKAVIDGMCERGWGRVVTISSGAGQIGIDLGVSPYGAGKGAGISFMRHLSSEVARFGVTANTIALGMIDNHYDPSVTESLVKGIPSKQLGTPDDVGAAVAYLASREAKWLTGQTIGLNGGFPTS